jgi:hypothetical protein
MCTRKCFWGAKHGRSVRLTTHRHLCADCLHNVGWNDCWRGTAALYCWLQCHIREHSAFADSTPWTSRYAVNVFTLQLQSYGTHVNPCNTLKTPTLCELRYGRQQVLPGRPAGGLCHHLTEPMNTGMQEQGTISKKSKQRKQPTQMHTTEILRRMLLLSNYISPMSFAILPQGKYIISTHHKFHGLTDSHLACPPWSRTVQPTSWHTICNIILNFCSDLPRFTVFHAEIRRWK